MKHNLLYFIILWVGLTSCSEPGKPDSSLINPYLEIPENIVDKSALVYDNNTSLWSYEGRIFSGYAVSFFPNDQLSERFGILNGRKQNQATYWYANGNLQRVVNYHKGKLHGEKKTWSDDSTNTLLSHFKYVAGKLHGEQKQWYPTGELFKLLNMNMGQEEGLQQAFRKNGALFANYEAREGRIYGLKKTKLCYGLEDEAIKRPGD